MLAIFLSFWTWLYTYKDDKTIFWVSAVLAAACGGLINIEASKLNSKVSSGRVHSAHQVIVACVVLEAIIWLAAIVGRVRSSEADYR